MVQWIATSARMLGPALIVISGLHGALAQAQTVYYHNDTAGSPIAASDETGSLLWQESYRPYGERMLKPSAANTQWFHGKQLDLDTGMQDFGARNYDPILGRFLSIDPVDFSDKNIHSFNRYAYGNGNPLKYKDPDGRTPAHLAAFLIGASIDMGAQMIFEGKTLSTVNYTSVVLSGVGAALTGGVGASMAKAALAQKITAVDAIKTTAMVGAGTSALASVGEDLADRKQPSGTKALISAVGGGLGAAAGAALSNAGASQLARMTAAGKEMGHVAGATHSSTNFGSRVVLGTSAAQEAGKTGIDAAAEAAQKVAEQNLSN